MAKRVGASGEDDGAQGRAETCQKGEKAEDTPAKARWEPVDSHSRQVPKNRGVAHDIPHHNGTCDCDSSPRT